MRLICVQFCFVFFFAACVLPELRDSEFSGASGRVRQGHRDNQWIDPPGRCHQLLAQEGNDIAPRPRRHALPIHRRPHSGQSSRVI